MIGVNDIAHIALLLEHQFGRGAAVHETTASVHLKAEHIQQIGQATGETPLDIGRGPGDYFHGRLRNFRLYGRSLTDQEVGQLAR